MKFRHRCLVSFAQKYLFLICITVLVLCLFILPVSAEAAEYHSLVFKVDSGEVTRPVSCVADSSGAYYICDAYYQQVTMLDQNGTQTGKLQSPLSLPIDTALTSDKIFVLDSVLDAVVVFDSNSAYLDTLWRQRNRSRSVRQPIGYLCR